MHKRIATLLGLILLGTPLAAQLHTVILDRTGAFHLIVQVSPTTRIIMNDQGEMLDLDTDEGEVSYYSDFHDYEAGKIESLGQTRFSYYSDFHDYEAGKVKQIGNIHFAYYSDFHDYEAGKVKQIGNARLTYYSDFHDYEAGKISRIGDVAITYYSDFNDYEAGKIKAIGPYTYSYFSDFDRNVGRLKSGKLQFEIDNLHFIYKAMRPRPSLSTDTPW